MNEMSKPEALGFTEHQPAGEVWAAPDMSVLQSGRRAAPAFPLESLGSAWAEWITDAAEAAAAPADYVALPLLAGASALIGNARWAQASLGWIEPPHLWCGVVGDSGSSKSPGADCLLRDVLPKIETNMRADFPEKLAEWRAAAELHKAQQEAWEKNVRDAAKTGSPPPLPPRDAAPPEPQEPRLRQGDVTIEKVASLLAGAAPKGLLVVRDELAGWLLGMTNYNDSGRAFWLEAYGGRPYRVERQKNPEPIEVQRLAVAVMGGTQPDKLAEMFKDADDGLLARFLWAWPEPRPFKLSRRAPNVAFATEALDRLRMLDLMPATMETPAAPVLVPLASSALPMLEAFAQDMQRAQGNAGGLLRSAYGKARGMVLRLSLVLEFMRWAASPGLSAPPREISEAVLAHACDLVAEYAMPMAARVYGDAATPQAERNAATLARWIVRAKPQEVHVRRLQRDVRLPGLRTAEAIRAACDALADADWLRAPPPGAFQSRGKVAYPVNPAILAEVAA
ncbi:DUF3987 domain-containing protein [Acidocella facilis]|uniref:DUF3987 domain-containing protein n=1 Tax=Acidocella facilis TaxID=525 RepID=UPI001F462978|nr:DUF3987 domain-containing protein [Acidocella facilis]